MSDLTVTSNPMTAAPTPVAPVVPSRPEPVLITEREVLLATAAATARPVVHRFTLHAFAAAMLELAHHHPRPRRHYPPRLDYLEHAAMAREMYRL
jgi:hypothetical protein